MNEMRAQFEIQSWIGRAREIVIEKLGIKFPDKLEEIRINKRKKLQQSNSFTPRVF